LTPCNDSSNILDRNYDYLIVTGANITLHIDYIKAYEVNVASQSTYITFYSGVKKEENRISD